MLHCNREIEDCPYMMQTCVLKYLIHTLCDIPKESFRVQHILHGENFMDVPKVLNVHMNEIYKKLTTIK